MKCNACQRRVKDSMDAKVQHFWKHHPDIVVGRFAQLFSLGRVDELLYTLGQYFGGYVQNKIQSGNR